MSTPLPLIYIAGPFRGATPYAVRKNVEAARDIGLTVAYRGGYPIIPHTMTSDFDKQLTDQFWLDGTMELLRRCDGILMGHRWHLSTGARAELDAALEMGMPVFYSNDLLWEETFGDWVRAWQENQRPRTLRDILKIVAGAAGLDSALSQVPPEPRLHLAEDSPRSTAPAAATASPPPPSSPETP